MKTIPETVTSQGERSKFVAAVLDATPSYTPADKNDLVPLLMELPVSTLKDMSRAAHKSSLSHLTNGLTMEVFSRLYLTPEAMDRFVTLLDDHYVEAMNTLHEEYLAPVNGDIVGQAITGVMVMNEKEVLTSKQQRQLTVILAASGLNQSLTSVHRSITPYGSALLSEDQLLLDYVRSHPDDAHFNDVVACLSTNKMFDRFVEVLESARTESQTSYALIGGII